MNPTRHQRFYSVACLAAAFLWTLPAPAQPAQPDQPAAPSGLEAAGELLRAAVEGDQTPGAALLTVRGGEIEEELYFGRFHGDLVLPLDGASAWLSTALALTLVDAGLLDLEDPLVKFFPEAPDDKAAITVRHLLSHTSGLPTSHPCLADAADSLDGCVGKILQTPLAGVPGKEFLFGATGLQVVGRIAEVAAGGSWEATFQQRVAVPLGLEKTTYGSGANPSIAFGARGSVREYSRFLTALLPPRAGSRPLLSPVLAVEMLTDHTAGTTRRYWPSEAAEGFGLGAWLFGVADERVSAAAPGRLGFVPWLFRDQDFAALTVFSTQPAPATELWNRLAPLVQEGAGS